MYGLRISIQDRDVRSVLVNLHRGLEPRAFGKVIGRDGAHTIRHHLIAYNAANPNKLGGQRTSFYLKAAKLVSFDVNDSSVDLNIAHRGIAQRYFGGTIKPVNSKLLTIPAVPEAYGRRARSFKDLELIGSRKHNFLALVKPMSTEISYGRRRKDGTQAVKRGRQHGGVMFWLVPSVTQAPDPNVLPSARTLETGIRVALLKHFHGLVDQQEARRGNEQRG